ncbi:MAG: hypothetical protein ACREO5_00775, partial [Candidatus Binatia bacterium]
MSVALLLSLLITNAFAVLPTSDSQKQSLAAPAIYTTDLTQLGRDGRLRESLSFEKETNRLIEVLGKGGSRQPVLIDEKGESPDMIVDQLAIRIARGNVPDSLKDKAVVKLMTRVLFSNTASAEQTNAIVNAILDQAVASGKQTILYVGELTYFVRSIDGNQNLISALANGKIAIVGGSSKAAYDDKIERDSRLANLFEKITVTSDESANASNAARANDSNEYRGDNVSSDLRDMMAQDSTGKKRIDVIIQAKNAENPVLRSLLADGNARITGQIGTDNTLVVN